MTQALLLLLAGLVCGAFMAWFFNGRFGYRLFDIMFLMWFYYALSVPLELLLGRQAPVIGLLPDLNAAHTWPYVEWVLLYYLLFAFTFCFAYVTVPLANDKIRAASTKTYQLMLPPLWLIVAVHLLFIAFYIDNSWHLSRQERFLLASQSPTFKLIGILENALFAFDFLYIIVSSDRRRSLAILLAIFLQAIAAGDRSTMAIFALIYMLRYQIRLSRPQKALLFCAGLIIFVYWKSAYTNLLNWYAHQDTELLALAGYGLSSEAIASYSIFVAFLKQGASAYWLGASYVKMPFLLTWPRFLSESSVSTLAEQYTRIFAPTLASRGGGLAFSALAESWLNFGALGPPLLGFVWGIFCRLLDNRQRDILFYLVAIILFRLFRSDFASLYKSWIVVFGGFVTVWFIILTFWRWRLSDGTSASGDCPMEHRRVEIG